MVYIFDMDGTLIDSMDYWIDYMRDLLIRYNCTIPENFVLTVTPMGSVRCCEYLQELGVKQSTEQILREMNEYLFKVYSETIPAKETVPETIRTLKEAGHTLAVLTASPHSTMDPCLKRLGLYDLFERVWSADEFGMQKSNPEIYRQVAAELNTRPEDCIFVDDNYTALKTAKEAGMRVFAAYDPYSEGYRAEIEALVECYAVKLEEILQQEYIDKWDGAMPKVMTGNGENGLMMGLDGMLENEAIGE